MELTLVASLGRHGRPVDERTDGLLPSLLTGLSPGKRRERDGRPGSVVAPDVRKRLERELEARTCG